MNTGVDADSSSIDDNHSVSSKCLESEQSFHMIVLPCEDSAAGLFLSNSFVCGAVARGSRSLKGRSNLPIAFSDFFRSFWGQQQVLVEDGAQLPGHVAKFLPILDFGDAAVGCASMWTLAFDGGAAAACTAAAAAIARAPFCSRYIEEVD
jgi:hypothetical protein